MSQSRSILEHIKQLILCERIPDKIYDFLYYFRILTFGNSYSSSSWEHQVRDKGNFKSILLGHRWTKEEFCAVYDLAEINCWSICNGLNNSRIVLICCFKIQNVLFILPSLIRNLALFCSGHAVEERRKRIDWNMF